jgi:hypothetical protein
MNRTPRYIPQLPLTFTLTATLLWTATVGHSISKPYGVNIWDIADWAQYDLKRDADVDRYRVAVIWGHAEGAGDVGPTSTATYNWWTPDCGFRTAQRTGARIMFMLSDVPGWASISRIGKEQHIRKWCEFIKDLLIRGDEQAPGKVDALDLCNEMCVWGDNLDRDVSWWYADLLKAVYRVTKQHNPNIAVLPTPCFPGNGRPQEGVIDDLYQMGCGPYMERTNIHYYVHDLGIQRDPMYQGMYHYPTVVRYMKYLSEQNGDFSSLVTNTEYGWITTLNTPYLTEGQKAQYYRDVLDVSRRSGFCDVPYMYPATSGSYPYLDLGNWNMPCHSAALIYTSTWNAGATPNIPTGEIIPSSLVAPGEYAYFTTSYYIYRNYARQYPQWTQADIQPLTYLPAATQDAAVPNAGFESGTAGGWTGITIDSTTRKSGQYAARASFPGATVRSPSFAVQANRLYEVMYWIKMDGDYPSGAAVRHWIDADTIDTRNYPGGWRRRRYKLLTGASQTSLQLEWTTGIDYMADPCVVVVDGPGVTISGINRSGYTAQNNFNTGSVLYTDFTYVRVTDAPAFLVGKPWIRAPGDDRNQCFGPDYLTFTINQPATVYVLYQWIPERQNMYLYGLTGIDRPEWLNDWTDTGQVVTTGGYEGATWHFRVFRKQFPAGQVAVGGASGTRATFWIDDVSVKALNFPPVQQTGWTPPNAPSNLRCNDLVNPTAVRTLTPTLSWVFSDPDSKDFQASCQILIADNQNDINNNVGNVYNSGRQESAASRVRYSGTPALTPSTQYWWKVRVWDFFGATSPWSAAATFTIASSVGNQPPAPNNLLTNGQTAPRYVTTPAPVLSWALNDPDPNDVPSAYRVIVGSVASQVNAGIGILWDSFVITSTAAAATYAGSALKPGVTYYWRVTAWDNYNASGTSTVAEFTMAGEINQEPVVAISTPSGPVSLPAGSSITIVATASDPDGSVVRVEFFAGSTKIGESTASPYSFTWTGLTAGTHVLTARATDNRGGTAVSAAVTLTVYTVGVQLQPGETGVQGGPEGYIDLRAHDTAAIIFHTTQAGTVKVRIYNTRGGLVREFTHRANGQEQVSIDWRVDTTGGRKLAAGVYVVRIQGGGLDATRKIAVVK